MTLDFVLDKIAGRLGTMEKKGIKIDLDSWVRAKLALDFSPRLHLLEFAE